jgi:hypothetical protein
MFAKNIDKLKVLSDLKTKGYCAIESFIKPEVIEEIENEVTKNRYSLNENIQNGIYYETQYYFMNLLSDSKKCYDFVTSNFVLDISKEYLGNIYRLRATRYYETMSGHIMKWHTDNKQERKKIKFTGLIFIIYVCDVDEGEFQFIEGSHKFSNKFDSPEINNEFVNKNYSESIKSFKLPKGSLLIYDATGIHRAKPFKNKKYVRKSLYFQIDAYDENSEKILLNTKFLNSITPEIEQLFGFGKENSYPSYPKTNLNRLPINGKILSLVSKWFIYRLVRNLFRTEPRRIAKFFKKFI